MDHQKYLRRFLDLYQYEYNVKKQKTGHVKLEARGSQCKVHIYINNIHLKEEEVLKAYLFKYDRGIMKGVLLGTIEVNHHIGQLKTQTKRENLRDTDWCIDDVAGVVVLKKDCMKEQMIQDISYGGTWDKAVKVNITEFMEVSKEEKNYSKEVDEPVEDKQNYEKRTLKVDEKKVDKKDFEIDTLQPKQENEFVEKVDEDPVVTEPLTKNNLDKEPVERHHKDVISLKPDQDEKESAPKSFMYDKIELGLGSDQENDLVESNLPPKNNSKSNFKEESNESVFQNHTEPYKILEKQFDVKELKALHALMFTEYPKMAPFEVSERLLDCIRIEPKDIAALPINIWMLMNNTFLLSGYQKYKHLILFKEEDLSDDLGYRYVLGVPGIYHKKDRFIAYLYGFNKFKCCADTYPKPGEYGYWIVDVPINF